jgi:asparagine synthase (glutamine-hydrolysing)
MCGFAALLFPGPTEFAGAIQPMLDAVRHRGPDGEGVVFFSGPNWDPLAGPVPAGPQDIALALGHRRLAVIDRSAGGHQPMADAGGECWVVFVGEIYNHLELRAELAAGGVVFRSASDTEVLLEAYRRWGVDCLDRCNGMFSILLVDRRDRTVLVARDRFGVKPLYYWVAPDGTIAFASEIKQFTKLPGWRSRLNGQRAYDFLNWGLLDHGAETLFRGVFQLGPGQRLLLPRDSLAAEPGRPIPARRWYRPVPRPFAGSFAEAAAGFRELLEDSVRLRLRADVPVGTCLSGGLDSSAIVMLMARELGAAGGGTQRSFTAGSLAANLDERPYAELVAAAAGAQATYLYPEPDGLFAELEDLVWHQDEPFDSTSVYAQARVFEAARAAGVTVMLDGQGADELLAGYHGFFAPHLAGLLRRGRLPTLFAEMAALRRHHGISPAKSLALILSVLLPEPARKLGRRLAGATEYAPAWLDLEVLGAEPRDPLLASGARAADLGTVSRAQLGGAGLQKLLHWEDRNAMSHSIEARLPFLDFRLVEFALGLPDAHKLSAGTTKQVLRAALQGVLPERVRTRQDKIGFATAEAAWMREDRPERFRALLGEALAAGGAIFTAAARRRCEDILTGRAPFGPLPWRIISFGLWLRRFSVAV